MKIDLTGKIFPEYGQFYVLDAGESLPYIEWEDADYERGFHQPSLRTVGFLTLTDTLETRFRVALQERFDARTDAERVITVPFEVKSGGIVVKDLNALEGADESEETAQTTLVPLANGRYLLHLTAWAEDDPENEPVEHYDLVFVREPSKLP